MPGTPPHIRVAKQNSFAAHETTNYSRESHLTPKEPFDLAACTRKPLNQLRPGHPSESTKHLVYMSFIRENGWRCRFRDADRSILLRQIVFRSAEKVLETARRGNGIANEIDLICLQQEIATGKGGLWLKLTEQQYEALCRDSPRNDTLS